MGGVRDSSFLLSNMSRDDFPLPPDTFRGTPFPDKSMDFPALFPDSSRDSHSPLLLAQVLLDNVILNQPPHVHAHAYGDGDGVGGEGGLAESLPLFALRGSVARHVSGMCVNIEILLYVLYVYVI